MNGPKRTVCDLFSDVGNAVIASQKSEVVCSSTEQLLESFEEYNKIKENNFERTDDTEFIVGSMDAVSLYTRLEAEKSATIIKEEVMNSCIVFENIDDEEVGIYLRKNLSPSYIRDQGYDDLLPKQVSKKNKKIYVENVEDVEDNDDDDVLYKYVESIEHMFLVQNEYENNDEMLIDDIEDQIKVDRVGKPEMMVSTVNKASTTGDLSSNNKTVEGICEGNNATNTSANVKENVKEIEGICERE